MSTTAIEVGSYLISLSHIMFQHFNIIFVVSTSQSLFLAQNALFQNDIPFGAVANSSKFRFRT
jgi:hypothetical protein